MVTDLSGQHKVLEQQLAYCSERRDLHRLMLRATHPLLAAPSSAATGTCRGSREELQFDQQAPNQSIANVVVYIDSAKGF
jgi:hypothetical protein